MAIVKIKLNSCLVLVHRRFIGEGFLWKPELYSNQEMVARTEKFQIHKISVQILNFATYFQHVKLRICFAAFIHAAMGIFVIVVPILVLGGV